ncbi:ATP12 family chaperone protein [Oceanibium sediminis]|uniref:ATP12 family chaperone protein n=1 Tax=Oceanibium sediminis TaxID=2026339 RepID=UPI000DD35746|nr:ATP12 family protein [Oceanibium sediminis]
MSFTAPQRRFWKDADICLAEGGGWSVLLDDRPLRTPGKALLAVPTAALARAVAAEWQAQDERIKPETMPFTRAANSAIDKVTPAHEAVASMLAEYGGSDLLCYRAAAPDALCARQKEEWDPWIEWCARAHGARLHLAVGVMPLEQPEASLSALAAAVRAHSAFELTALHDLVTLSGSLVLGLAVSGGAIDPERAWGISRLDETWQAEQWGADEEAARAAAEKAEAFAQAARLLALVRQSDPEEG